MKYLTPFFIGAILSVVSYSQTSILKFHQLTPDEGLSETTIDFLYMDNNRFTWIGTMDGVNHFDGKEVVVYKSGNNNPKTIQGVNVSSDFFEDNEGNIWFTTGEGINCYQKKSRLFIHDYARRNQDSAKVHYAFHLEKGKHLWVTAGDNLFRYNIDSPLVKNRIPFIENFSAARAAVDTSDNGDARFVYGCKWGYGKGLILLNVLDTTLTTLFDTINHPETYTLTVSQVLPKINGTTACFLTDKGLLFLNPYNKEIIYDLQEFPDNFPNVNCIEKIGDYLWLSNNTSQIALYSLRRNTYVNKRISPYNVDAKNYINSIDRIFLGKDSIVWIGVRGAGVYYANIKNNGLYSLLETHGITSRGIRYIYENKAQGIWCVPERGMGFLFDKKKLPIDSADFLGGFKQVFIDDDREYAISDNFIREKNAGIIKWQPIPFDAQLYDAVPYGNAMLVGSTGGLYYYEDKSSYKLLGSDETFAVKLFIGSNKWLWVATASDRLHVFDASQIPYKIVAKDSFNNMGIMNDIKEDSLRKCLWVGTSKGLVKFQLNTIGDSISIIKTLLTELDGLPNQYINSILIDSTNHLWLSTNKGIIRYIPESEPDSQFMTITIRNGLSSNQYMAGAALYSKSGELWFGSTKGVDVINPEINMIGDKPYLSIRNLKVNGNEWDINLKQPLHHKKNSLEFKLSALEYLDPLLNKFEVYLHHYNQIDTDYIEKGNSVNYSFLSPGDYELRFKASNAEGQRQEKPIKLKFKIDPPFYETWWFRTLIALLIAAILIAISSFYYRFQLREKQMKLEKIEALQKERDRIASEMHDELGGGLSTIRNASAIAIGGKNPDELKSTLSRISQISFGLIKNMRELIWAMDPKKNSLEELIARVRNYTAEFLSDNKIPVSINIQEGITNLAVRSQARHNILLTVKELLHNVVKHAEATEVKFNLDFDDNLKIGVNDNGKGFDMNKNKKDDSYGLKNCKKRIETIGGEIEWTMPANGGTEVVINIPIDALKNS